MTGIEFNILAGVITAAVGAGVAWGTTRANFGARITGLERFRDTEHPRADSEYRDRCHGELLEEIREVRRTQAEQFDRLNERLDKAISFRTRRASENGNE